MFHIFVSRNVLNFASLKIQMAGVKHFAFFQDTSEMQMLAHWSHLQIFSAVVNVLITSTAMQFTIQNSLRIRR